MDWIFDEKRPIYAQILEQLKNKIISGDYPPGSKFPSVRELAADAEVNPNTMQKALVELERQGLLVTHRASGRTVTDNTNTISTFKKNDADILTKEYVEQMNQLGFSSDEIKELVAEKLK